MSVVAVAIVISFHLKHQPTEIERRIALPLGLIFWFLSLACLASGLANYIKTVARYSRRVALVQTGWKTQTVIHLFFCTSIEGSLADFSGIHCGSSGNSGGMCSIHIH
jgi:hypothetical protein